MSEAIIYRGLNSNGAGLFGYPPNPTTYLRASAGNGKVELTWSDPDDRVVEGITVGWSYTRVVRKTGSYPTSPYDGTTVVQNTTKNQYQVSAYIDSGLNNGTIYYYAAYACSDYGIFAESAPTVSAKPVETKIMTVVINEDDLNPRTCCSWADDAINMPDNDIQNYRTANYSSTEWEEFFGYRPCLFKNGQVVGYLDPNDYSKFEDGSSADITSGESGDVMIEFPRRDIKMTKSGNTIRISMTNDLGRSGYTHYAHTRDTEDVDNFYISAYFLSLNDSRHAQSLSASTEAYFTSKYWSSSDIGTIFSFFFSLSDGYHIICYYQWLYLQIMTVMQFKTLQSGDFGTAGSGDEMALSATIGVNNSKGMNYFHDGQPPKLFGIESLVGLYPFFIGGIGIYWSEDMRNHKQIAHILAATKWKYGQMTSSEEDLSFFNMGELSTYSDTIGNMSYRRYFENVVGTSEAGFIPTSRAGIGSSTTNYCDGLVLDLFASSNYGYDKFDYLRVGGNTDGVCNSPHYELESGSRGLFSIEQSDEKHIPTFLMYL